MMRGMEIVMGRGVSSGGGGGIPMSSTYIEAEDADVIGTIWTIQSDADASGGMKLYFVQESIAGPEPPTTDSIVEFNGISLEAGTYEFWMRWKQGYNLGNSCFTKFPGESTYTSTFNTQGATLYFWEKAGRTFTVAEGLQSIYVAKRESLHFDKFYLTKNGDTPV